MFIQFEFEGVSSQRPAVVQRSSLLLPFPYKLKVMDQNFKTHSGEKPNKCNQCDFASSQIGNLRRHLITHSGEKPNKCNQCDFASSQASTLRTRRGTHSGEKPNKCIRCDFTPTKAGYLRNHLKIPQGHVVARSHLIVICVESTFFLTTFWALEEHINSIATHCEEKPFHHILIVMNGEW